MQAFIERIILYSRFILVVFYLGLAAALAIFAVSFVMKLAQFGMGVMGMDDTRVLLSLLVLIDKALVAGLVVMVMLSSYENFVGTFDKELKQDSPSWLGRLDPGSLKIKVAAAIVAISSVHLLQVFMDMQNYTEQQIFWKTIIHLAFIVSALLLGVLDRMTVIWRERDATAIAPRKSEGHP